MSNDKSKKINHLDVRKINPRDKLCAPGKKFMQNTCLDLADLEIMARSWNKAHRATPKKQIVLKSDLEPNLNKSQYQTHLLAEFYNKIQECDTQLCWTQNHKIKSYIDEPMKNYLSNYVWVPEGPHGKGNETWLNTNDIDKVLYQYEIPYKDFKFLGAVPNDFDDVAAYGIRTLKYKSLMTRGKTKLGIVFNLDSSWQDGSHWSAAFANLLTGQIYYYDSYGEKPTPEVLNFLNRLKKFCQEELNNENAKVRINKVRHQYGESECGVFSINFITALLNGREFTEYCNSKPSDAKINMTRDVIFR
jgi:hypothetical protein